MQQADGDMYNYTEIKTINANPDNLPKGKEYPEKQDHAVKPSKLLQKSNQSNQQV